MKYLAVLLVPLESVKNFAYLTFAVFIVSMVRSKGSDLKGYLRLADENKQLEETIRLLESQNKLKDRLLSIVSHDIRAPLGSLKSLLQLLMRKNITTHELQEVTVILDRQVELLNIFVENLLRWTKNHYDHVEPNKERLRLQSLANEAIELLQLLAYKKQVRIHSAIADDVMIFADAEMIKLVLRNLISNAIKFCSAHDNIYIHAFETHEGVGVSVRDTGRGISKENIEKLFGLSNLSTKGTKDEIGIGLGLTLCREFVEKHDGRIHVSSQEGHGSCFEFTLPHPLKETEVFVERQA